MAALVITPEIEAAAQELAAASGTTPTEAVAEALRSKLESVHVSRPSEKKSLAELQALLAPIHSGPIDWTLTEDEILGYDEYGVPEQPYLGR